MLKIIYTSLFLFLSTFSFSQTVMSIIEDSPDHTTLETLINAAGLNATLAGTGNFTVFAPTDLAFAALDPTLVATLQGDPTGKLNKALLYHVLGTEVFSSSLFDGQTANTLLSGQDITVSINGMMQVFINTTAQVTTADLDATNGVLHVLNGVLLPPSLTVADVVINSAVHTTLESAVIDAGLAGTLSDLNGNFTVFAPTDAAFANLDAAVLTTLTNDPTGKLANALLYHVLGAEVLSSSLTNGQTATTLFGQDITVTIDANGVMINDANVIIADIVTLNGVVHVLDAVILPPNVTVADVVINSAVHTTLETAVIDAGLAGTLSDLAGTFTVFAPTDDAFANLDAAVLSALTSDPTGKLANALLYHVLGAEVLSTDLSDGQTATTLFGQDITVTIDANGVQINGANVTIADIKTLNGVVHVLDAVILPPNATVADVVINSAVHTTLEGAVIDAGLAGTLSDLTGTFTVFAPTDDAFANLDAAVLSALTSDPTKKLQRALLYHVLGAEVLSSTLTDGQTATTLFDQDITVTVDANGVQINGANVTVADIQTLNGVVHVLDAVILPPNATVADVVINSAVHTTLETAVDEAGLVPTLSDLTADFTVFAPVDDAFTGIDVAALLADPTGDLTKILQYHVLGSEVLSSALTDGQVASTLLGQDVTVTIDANGVMINNALVTVADILTLNGVVHVINTVLLPDLTSVKNLDQVNFKVSPNPTTEFITIDVPETMIGKNVDAQLINMNGAILNTWNINDSKETINVSNYPAGTYILLLVNETNYARSTVVIK